MGVYRVRMPQLGETVEEGTVVSWHVEEGTQLSVGAPLLEISTDKVDSEIESTVEGVLVRVLVAEGDTVAVGSVLAEVEVEGYVDDARVPAADDAEAGTAPASADDAAAADAAAASAAGAVSADDVTAAEAPADDVPAADQLLLSPVVRRMIDEHGIDVDDLAAFATTPKVTRKVVEDYLSQRAPQDAEVVAFTRIRSLTAARMVESKAVSPHVYTGIEVDFEQIAQLRDRVHPRLTWLPFVACALARTLEGFGRLNASVRDDALVIHRRVHLGVAVDLDGEGLVVPVVDDAHELGVVAMSQRIRELAERARAGRLTHDDVSGGTFTITGQGPHGTLFTAPIINQPQVAILSVDGIRRRPVVVGDDIVAHHTGVLTLSWDHRAVDGVYAARFLDALRGTLEQHDWLAEMT